MPVAVVPRQPRGLQSENGADPAGANGLKQSAEAGTFDRARSSAALVFIDHDDTLKDQCLRTFAKVVLATLPFKTCPDLLHGGLPYISKSVRGRKGRRRVARASLS
jgi:hypothetical protein